MLQFNDGKLYESLTTEKWTETKRTELVQDQWVMMAMGYKKAAEVLVAGLPAALLIGAEQQYIACPIMFLYRHFLEISLKGLMLDLQELGKQLNPLIGVDPQVLDKGLPAHPLMESWLPVRQLLFELSPDEDLSSEESQKLDTTLNAIETRIKELDQIDGHSFSYRYPSDRKNNPSLGPLPSHQELQKVADVVETIEAYFGGFRSWIHDYRTAMTMDQYR